MGGLAGAAGGGVLRRTRTPGPIWLDGGDPALTIAADAPTVWSIDLDDPAVRRCAEAIAPLPEEAAAFARRHDAGERATRRRLSRFLLAAAGGSTPAAVSIGTDEAGAPVVLAPAGWHLSVAGRWPDAVIAVARVPVGVDLERITTEPPVTDVLSPTETRWLHRLAGAERHAAFAACWAVKEAHAKWTRQPRALHPAAIEAGDAGLARSRLGTTRCWRRRRGALVAAVCVAA